MKSHILYTEYAPFYHCFGAFALRRRANSSQEALGHDQIPLAGAYQVKWIISEPLIVAKSWKQEMEEMAHFALRGRANLVR